MTIRTKLSLAEMAILSSATRPQSRHLIATGAVELCASPVFDYPVALASVDKLKNIKYLSESECGGLEITALGRRTMREAYEHAKSVLPSFRAAT